MVKCYTEGLIMNYIYEIFLKSPNVNIDSWNNYLKSIGKFLGFLKSFKIIVKVEYNKVRYFIIIKRSLPNSFNNDNFLIKQTDESFNIEANFKGFKFYAPQRGRRGPLRGRPGHLSGPAVRPYPEQRG